MFQQLLDLSFYQWSALVFGLIYIYFAVHNRSICFIFGLISSAFWAYESYFILNLQFDAFLQLFYVLMSIWGLIAWWSGQESKELPISSVPFEIHALLVLLCISSGIALAYIGERYLGTNMAFLDAFTTGLLIVATILLVRRIIENWLYFIIADLIYLYIYGKSGAYLFVFIMIVYTIMAILGFKKWQAIKESI